MEVLHQNSNPVVFNIATGTGKLGGALISSNLENSFFSNRIVEKESAFLKRQKENKQYKSQKLHLALGASLIKKSKLALDAGIMFKRHKEIGKINPGAGISGRLGFFTWGGALYQDDFILDPSLINEYSEKFNVLTYTAGIKYKRFSFDAGVIKTKYKVYDQHSSIHLYSASYGVRNFIFNVAIRNEISPGLKFIDGKLVEKKSHNEFFGSLQTSFGKHLIIGLNYNYFLLDEFSYAMTLFF